MIIFRATTMGSAINLIGGMAGFNGIALPTTILDHLGPLSGWLRGVGVAGGLEPDVDANKLAIWIPALTVIALTFPNTLQVLARHEPALGIKASADEGHVGRRVIAWSASPAWAIILSVVAAVAVSHLGGESEFLYWQF